MEKIRIGIDLDHVIRDINRQIVKYYQKDIDESIDIDDVDYKDDVIKNVCHFDSKDELGVFLYEDYPLEIFGHAGQIDRNLSRDINLWMGKLTNQEDYDVELFFYSMKERDLTIQSSYFFLSKIGSRVRKVVFPRSIEELNGLGDVFITAYAENARSLYMMGKKVIYIKTHCNGAGLKYADASYDSLREFLDDEDKLNNVVKIAGKCQKQKKTRLSWTSMRSWISFFLQMKKK